MLQFVCMKELLKGEIHFAQYDVAKENQFMGKNALIMGKLYRRNGDWKFAAIGDAFDDQNDLRQTVKRILTSYSK